MLHLKTITFTEAIIVTWKLFDKELFMSRHGRSTVPSRKYGPMATDSASRVDSLPCTNVNNSRQARGYLTSSMKWHHEILADLLRSNPTSSQNPTDQNSDLLDALREGVAPPRPNPERRLACFRSSASSRARCSALHSWRTRSSLASPLMTRRL